VALRASRRCAQCSTEVAQKRRRAGRAPGNDERVKRLGPSWATATVMSAPANGPSGLLRSLSGCLKRPQRWCSTMRVSIKVIRELDGTAIHERIVDLPEDRRVGNFVDEIFEKIWPEMDVPGASKYKVIIEAAE